ncbi:MAG: PadR family transcriptional regulator [Gemmatimonadaceae bacterium]
MTTSLGNTDYALLGMLKLEPMSGYQLRREIADSLAYFWSESFGQIYPALKRLTALKLITPVRRTTRDTGRGQQFALTPRGESALADWIALPAEPQPPRNQLLLKLFFGRAAKADVSLTHLRESRDRATARVASIRVLGEQIKRERGSHPDAPQWLMTVRHGELQTEAHLQWCEESIAALLKRDRHDQRPVKSSS